MVSAAGTRATRCRPRGALPAPDEVWARLNLTNFRAQLVLFFFFLAKIVLHSYYYTMVVESEGGGYIFYITSPRSSHVLGGCGVLGLLVNGMSDVARQSTCLEQEE